VLEEGRIVPQANDAELTELYSAATGLDVEDDQPNLGPPGGPPSNIFDLHLEAVAGNVIGNGAANYRLTITCIDDMLAAPNASMSPGTLNQQFNAANGWQAGGAAGNFVKEQIFPITVPLDARGHVFHYIATLVSINGDIVSFIESNSFILV
jgi:hypothetical protein